uniref:RNA-binding protein n=1 Tax=Tobacco leaf enation phytoreovirus TaxID=288891 RepID=A2RQI8_9REOV|nr:unknown [Tobacco leaf enation phytoreovirus]
MDGESLVSTQTVRVNAQIRDYLKGKFGNEPPALLKIEHQTAPRYRTCICPQTDHLSETCPSGDVLLSVGSHRHPVSLATIYNPSSVKSRPSGRGKVVVHPSTMTGIGFDIATKRLSPSSVSTRGGRGRGRGQGGFMPERAVEVEGETSHQNDVNDYSGFTKEQIIVMLNALKIQNAKKK